MSLFSTAAQFVTLAPSGSEFLLRCDGDMKEALRETLPGLRKHHETGAWLVPGSYDAAMALRAHKLPFTQNATKLQIAVKQKEIYLENLSKSEDGSIDLGDFGKLPYPFQCSGIEYALAQKKVIIGDDMGLGKTIQGLGTLHKSKAFPALVVVPSSNKYNWAEDEIPVCMPGVVVVVASKNTSLLDLQAADIIVTNYEQLVGFRKVGKQRTSWTDETKKIAVLSPLAKKIQMIRPRTIILDEAHKIKETSTATTNVLMQLRHSAEYRLLLTGTPMLNFPREFWSLIKFLDLGHYFGGHDHFMNYYCVQERTSRGLEAKGCHDGIGLNTKMRRLCYVRRRKVDVLKDLPPKVRVAYKLDLDNRSEYDYAENHLVEWVQDRVNRDKRFLESIAHLDERERRIAIMARQNYKADAAERAEQIVMINALKLLSVEGKVKAAKDWIKNFLAQGEKLVVFCTHIDILNELEKAHPGCCRIRSEDSPEQRQNNVRRFQQNAKANLLIGAMGTSAGSSPAGVGHTLTAASNVLFLNLGWNPALHDQCEDRCNRIGQKNSVTCHYLLGKNTIEEVIAEAIEEKRKVSAQVVDGLDIEVDEGILSRVSDYLASKIGAQAA